jgi:hypothetical protein
MRAFVRMLTHGGSAWGEKRGQSALSTRRGNRAVLAPNMAGALGQSGLSPFFRAVMMFNAGASF